MKDSLREKIAQMLIVGFRGVSVDERSPIVRSLIDDNLGGVILFDYDCQSQKTGRNIINPQQLRTLTCDLQRFALEGAKLRGEGTVPLFISIDYEGGEVNRLKDEYGFPKTLSAAELAQGEHAVAEKQFKRMAETLFEHGLNLNFAPVVDLSINPDNPVISRRKRSFSNDFNVVTSFAGSFIQAMKARGIACSLKHFPGHGSSENDTHHGFVDITHNWDPIELEPYRRLLKEPGLVDMVMTCHVFHQKLDTEYPATLSEKLLQGLLREKLGYRGVVVTDDLQMEAITHAYSTEEVVVRAIKAGCDLLVFGNQLGDKMVEPIDLIDTIEEACLQGEIAPERIESSYRRIINLKKGLNIAGNQQRSNLSVMGARL